MRDFVKTFKNLILETYKIVFHTVFIIFILYCIYKFLVIGIICTLRTLF